MPRAWIRAFENKQTQFILGGMATACAISLVVSLSWRKSLPVPTMTKEYQEMTDEYMKFMNMNPIFGKCQ